MGCGSGKATALCVFKCQLVARRACDLVMHCLKKEPSRRSVGTVWRLGGRQTKCECRDRSDVSAAPA